LNYNAIESSWIGILGGGQLGRMLALSGYPLGLRFRIFDPSPLAPAGHLAEHVQGAYDDTAALDRFVEGLSVVSYEFENVPVQTARHLNQRAPVYPPPQALETAQDRLSEKTLFQKLGVETPPFAPLFSLEELTEAVARVGLPAVLKTRRLGYDGKGQAVLRTPEDVERAHALLRGSELILEGFVPFERELSILGVRGRDGASVFYPLVENHHRDGILRLSLAPAPGDLRVLQQRAEAICLQVMKALDYVGVLAIEFFQHNGRLLANEMAPRVHNSGHWSMEGAEVSQFENHIRAIAGLPLGSTRVRGCAAMLNLIGELPGLSQPLGEPRAHAHFYGKAPAPGRKVGHINIVTETADERADVIRKFANCPGVYDIQPRA